MSKRRILAVDDEPSIVKLVGDSLRQEGYEVVEASDGEQALQAAEQSDPALIILDIGMPKLNGFDVCQRIREWSQVPIIMLSARTESQDKVKCLTLGADDYLEKPFSIEELKARVGAVLRRMTATNPPLNEPTVTVGQLRVDFAERRVTVSCNEVRLTPTEYNVLGQLVLHRGKVLAHRMLLQQVWGQDYSDEREYLHVVINKLRKKIDSDPGIPGLILTVPGVGYRLESA